MERIAATAMADCSIPEIANAVRGSNDRWRRGRRRSVRCSLMSWSRRTAPPAHGSNNKPTYRTYAIKTARKPSAVDVNGWSSDVRKVDPKRAAPITSAALKDRHEPAAGPVAGEP
jgi:hypothetical protein